MFLYFRDSDLKSVILEMASDNFARKKVCQQKQKFTKKKGQNMYLNNKFSFLSEYLYQGVQTM